MGGLSPKIEQELEKGRRAVAIGWYSGSWENAGELPEEILPLYSVILEDTIRRNAAKTLEFFHTEGVDVKIISGDHVRTVSMIAKRAGLRRWMEAVDMSVQGENPDYDRLCAKYAVFARVTPAQKKELVLALKRQGRQVAMTGDGVNDLLALREADCSIAVADGSDASRQISQIVLLDSDFTNLPQADSGKLPEDGAFPCAALRLYGDRHDYPDEPYCPVFAGRKADSDVPSAGFDFHGCSDTKLYPVYEAQNAYLRCHGGRNRLRTGTVSFAAGASGSHAVHGILWSVRRGFMPAFRAGAG